MDSRINYKVEKEEILDRDQWTEDKRFFKINQVQDLKIEWNDQECGKKFYFIMSFVKNIL